VLSQTLIIIIITCAISIPAFKNRKMVNDLWMYPPDVNRGQYYRFLTSGFVHADWQHLIFNMLTFWSFGQAMEPVLNQIAGRFGFIIFYITAIIVSDIPSYFKNRNNNYYASLGASGGVSAVMFGFILFAPWQWFTFPPVPAIIFAVIYVIYSSYMSRKGNTGINHDAHIWGGLYGIAFILIAEPKVLNLFIENLKHPHF
jgi:membrane associated rhomboid family serine protease